ncbi:MAG TPA: sigma 54-interacting transcriptional regulator, partial [Puia sp.]|nr:sigma 54-interacting transcriptional regulator [Puia sp.]
MDSFFLVVALVMAGISLLAGTTNITTGFHKEADRAELVFGFQTISLFIFVMLPPVGFILKDQAPYPFAIEIKRIFIWAYYLLLPVFIKEYSGYRNKLLLYSIFSCAVVAYFIMALTKYDTKNPLWSLVAELTFGLILLYGVAGVRFQLRHGQPREAKWLLWAMALFGILYVCSVFLRVEGKKLFFPFHLNVLVFITIMSIRMRFRQLEKYGLEKALRWKETQWNLLLQNMQIIIVELDQDANIKYLNSFAVRKLGYGKPGDLIGQNWFDLVGAKDESVLRKSIYHDDIRNEKLLSSLTTDIWTKAGEKLVINWTNVLMLNSDDSSKGILSIGMDNTELVNAFEQVQLLKNELEKENLALKSKTAAGVSDHDIIGESEAILYAIQKARQVAMTNAGVLLLGETGSGKELFANLIHKNSYRLNKAFVKINCATLPAELIESELFGHEKGSFTGALMTRKGKFELADGGTIFLDEIGELPVALQPKLLRVLQSGEFERIGGDRVIKVDVRIVAATNRNLAEEVKAGKFREDLYYRLNVFPITIPALRKRKEDIPLLISHYIKKFSDREKRPVTQISRADMSRL